MHFDLRGQHLGDVLLAMPAMRAGDSVIVDQQHRVPGLPVHWLDTGVGLTARAEPWRHITDGWLVATDRAAVQHVLIDEPRKDLVVIAPDVNDPGRRWSQWEKLRMAIPHAVIVDDKLPRLEWMELLSRASAVICPNTGTAHMADALGCPRVIGLYTGLKRAWLPYWNRQSCIVADTIESITVADVLEVFRRE